MLTTQPIYRSSMMSQIPSESTAIYIIDIATHSSLHASRGKKRGGVLPPSFAQQLCKVASVHRCVVVITVIFLVIMESYHVIAVPLPPSRDLTKWTWEECSPGPMPQHYKCRSDINLTIAMRWLGDIPKRELRDWLVHLPIGRHRSAILPELPYIKGIQFGSYLCNEEGCIRCSSGMGGYMFKHLGPWAPEWVICPDGMHPRVHHAICMDILDKPSHEGCFFRNGVWRPGLIGASADEVERLIEQLQ